MLLRLGFDGYVDRVIVNPTAGTDMIKVLRKARDAVAVAKWFGEDRLRRDGDAPVACPDGSVR